MTKNQMRFLYSTANISCLLFLWRQMQQHTVCYLMNACHSAFWLSCLAAATNTNTKDDVLCSVDYSCTTACHRPLFATAQGDDRPPWPFTVGFVVQQKLSKFATVTLLEGSFWLSAQAVELKSFWLCSALWLIGNTPLSRIAHSLDHSDRKIWLIFICPSKLERLRDILNSTHFFIKLAII